MTHTSSHSAERRGRLQRASVLTLAFVAGAVLLLWGYNTVAADLLGAPSARFVHALAAQAGLLGLMLPALVWSRVRAASAP
jgi:hypothetical protein